MANVRSLLVPKLCLGTHLSEAPLRVKPKQSFGHVGSQAELGNQWKVGTSGKRKPMEGWYNDRGLNAGKRRDSLTVGF